MSELWTIAGLNVDSSLMDYNLPDNVYPISLKIALALSCDAEEFTYEEDGELKTFSDEYYDERTFTIYRVKKGIFIKPTRITFENPLFQEGNVDYEKFLEDKDDAIKYIEESEQPKAANRVYLEDFRFCKIPEEYAEGNGKWNSKLYEDEKTCWIAKFGKASSQDDIIQITSKARRKDGIVEGMAPGRTLVPCVLSSLKRVCMTDKIRKVRPKTKFFWTEKKLEKSHLSPEEWLDRRSKEWNRDSGKGLNEEFEKRFKEITQKDDYPFFKKVDLSGDRREREVFKVKEVAE